MNTEKELYNDYSIKISSIAQGKQMLNFDVPRDFFELLFDDSDFSGTFKLELILDRNNHVFNLEFFFSGKYSGNCNRCLAPLERDASFNEAMVVKETEYGEGEDTDEIIFIDIKDESINIAQLIYEFCRVHYPLRFVHENEGDCDQSVIDKLNSEEEENTSETEVDPRWAALNKLK